jgi:hypothetical protein
MREWRGSGKRPHHPREISRLIMRAYERQRDLPNLLLDDELVGRDGVAAVVAPRRDLRAVERDRRATLSSSLAYFDSYRSAELPQNLTQAQRDYFGSHVPAQRQRPDAPFVHTDWIHNHVILSAPGAKDVGGARSPPRSFAVSAQMTWQADVHSCL